MKVFTPAPGPGSAEESRRKQEQSTSPSRCYGGTIRKVRLLSRNRRIQSVFCVGPGHA